MRLRTHGHPDLSDFVVHFTGRPRQRANLDPSIRGLAPEKRLERILRDRQIRAFQTFYASTEVVCFTESTLAGLGYVIQQLGYEPWGIVFDKQVIWDAGGGPVAYVRDDEWHLVSQIPEPIRSRAVKYGPGHDWVEEREWRLRGTGMPTAFRFTVDQVHAILVPDITCRPTRSRWSSTRSPPIGHHSSSSLSGVAYRSGGGTAQRVG